MFFLTRQQIHLTAAQIHKFNFAQFIHTVASIRSNNGRFGSEDNWKRVLFFRDWSKNTEPSRWALFWIQTNRYWTTNYVSWRWAVQLNQHKIRFPLHAHTHTLAHAQKHIFHIEVSRLITFVSFFFFYAILHTDSLVAMSCGSLLEWTWRRFEWIIWWYTARDRTARDRQTF